MKNIYLIIVFQFLIFTAFGQTYVDQSATGANDGTSWDNAYTDLSDALANSSPNDEIWVAAGIYKPGGTMPSPDTFFTFPHDLLLYGGFAGTETNLSERDWETNETILSGDHNDDDTDDVFDANKTDNSKHVMWLTDTVTTASTIDGFTIRNGNTEPGSSAGDLRRGGGILTYGAPAIRNCYFTQNFGHFGGGLYPRIGGAAGVIIENCVFEKNQGGFGGGVYLNATTATVENCEFIENVVVTLGGGLYNNSLGGSTISNCTFTANQATESRGGGLYNTSSPSIITDCDFFNNFALASSGGALQVRSDDDDPFITVEISNCTFQGSRGRFGGAVGIYDEKSIANFTNCDFSDNEAENVGGALSNAFGATTSLTACNFEGNLSNGSGGAVFSQNDSAVVNILDCILTLNVADRGGAVAMSGDDDPNTTAPLAVLNVENSFLTFNNGTDQGGGVNIDNTNANFTNVLFSDNFTDATTGIGGGVSFNTADTIVTAFGLMNCTFVNNIAAVGAGISNWQPGMEGGSTLTMQNSIFQNPIGNNYEIEAGEPTVISNGGNLSSDASAVDFLTGTNDLNETDPEFVGLNDEDYRLSDMSPAIDAGIATNAPLFDIEGNPRVDDIDMGAYENQKTVSVDELEKAFGTLDIYPNPVVGDRLDFTFESEWNGELLVQVVDMNGRVLIAQQIKKVAREVFKGYGVQQLSQGVYSLTITNGSETVTKRFVK
ncbi:MAG: T9SS type A sorting domain-containing protein [Bacteroidota bacterium]